MLKISPKDYRMHLHFPRLLWTNHFLLPSDWSNMSSVGFAELQHNQDGLKWGDLGPWMHKRVEKSLLSFLYVSCIVQCKHSLPPSTKHHPFLSIDDKCTSPCNLNTLRLALHTFYSWIKEKVLLHFVISSSFCVLYWHSSSLL